MSKNTLGSKIGCDCHEEYQKKKPHAKILFVEDVVESMKKIFKKLESQMIEGNKLKFSHTIITIKEELGEELL